jgi:uncharacterized membrane protein
MPGPMSSVSMSAADDGAPFSGRSPERLEAFSDGVFAIAITLLVLEIRVPGPEQLASPDKLVAALSALWPSYVGYVVSFLTVGIMWANHHNLFRYVAAVDHWLLLANILLLLGVGFVPFPTALLAATLGGPSEQIGVLVYAATFVGIAIGFNVLWYRAQHGGRLLRADADPRAIEAITRSYRLGVPGYLAAFLAALVSPVLGMAVIVGFVILFLLPTSSGG